MWVFCGAEHYTEEYRWRERYFVNNRPAYESGFDLNRWVWNRKRLQSLACGTPVVAFNTCGLPDIVDHQRTGYLAQPFDTDDLAKGIEWILADKERLQVLRHNARQKAVATFAYPIVASQYQKVYERVLGK